MSTRRTALAREHSHSIADHLVGVFGANDPAALLRSSGVESNWTSDELALGGGTLGFSENREVVASGTFLLDNSDRLRQSLERPEATDADLIAELYSCHGPDAGQYALGMFAGAIWDLHQRQLMLIRDAAGARTIYYASRGGICSFSTGLTASADAPASPATSRSPRSAAT